MHIDLCVYHLQPFVSHYFIVFLRNPLERVYLYIGWKWQSRIKILLPGRTWKSGSVGATRLRCAAAARCKRRGKRETFLSIYRLSRIELSAPRTAIYTLWGLIAPLYSRAGKRLLETPFLNILFCYSRGLSVWHYVSCALLLAISACGQCSPLIGGHVWL